jgi:ergothioneine biosynthesis protein EgtB
MRVQLPRTRTASDDLRARTRDRLAALFAETRACTERLAAALSPEDQQLQSMPDASPTKWHRAHTTWFFETFVLLPAGVDAVDPRYAFLFNSYYEAAGPRQARASRGLVSRPTAAEIGAYRRAVDARVSKLLAEASAETLDRALPIVELGIAHEEQHQELVLTDILNAFWQNPTHPAVFATREPDLVAGASDQDAPLRFISFDGGVREVGALDGEPFVFDNERPRHKVWVEPFALADRLLTVGDLKGFLDAGGYRTPSLWLQEGYDFIRTHAIESPLYSTYEGGELRVFTLHGERVASDGDPVTHLSYYEADALARFLGARLPTEAEWEIVAATSPVRGNFLDDGALRPLPVRAESGATCEVRQLFGDAWQWTSSSYEPYPGFEAPAGALGEYNGKFMVNQKVLRGGSCLTPKRHIRASYRNFWHPPTRFQMIGGRLARGRAR